VPDRRDRIVFLGSPLWQARDAYKAASAKVEAAYNAYDKYVQQQQASPGDASHVQKVGSCGTGGRMRACFLG